MLSGRFNGTRHGLLAEIALDDGPGDTAADPSISGSPHRSVARPERGPMSI
jgi:hypothetical protein